MTIEIATRRQTAYKTRPMPNGDIEAVVSGEFEPFTIYVPSAQISACAGARGALTRNRVAKVIQTHVDSALRAKGIRSSGGWKSAR